ncbi:myb/SANT-like DNA-binding domain-containing protein 1 [Teleopsis dalmanni]|uniref:myb/SANT-like DNA-binding domain-containing protein 1 n=1 Tax=Teleopsis dalmanni TaxID=139649 RepID=UPI0018CD066B|nr:myb/SANT-like DNA-binding domain-containing protein 1 [Teleopsis dalmanni]
MKRRRNAWSESAERHFLEIWEERLPQLRGARRNAHIFNEMATELQNRGFLVTSLEVQTKVHNFTQRFRKEQQCVGVSGGAPSDWKYFHILKRFLGNLPIHNTTNLVFESIAGEFSQICLSFSK